MYRKFGICRICFRNLADQGLIPGVEEGELVERLSQAESLFVSDWRVTETVTNYDDRPHRRYAHPHPQCRAR